jgi:hypothetical protein
MTPQATRASRLCVLALGMAMVAGPPASAEPGSDEQRAACTPDVFRLCGAEIPNVEKIVACLKREKPRLSAACQAVFNEPAAPATRSAAAGEQRPCSFQNSRHSSQKDWSTWCGPASGPTHNGPSQTSGSAPLPN